MRAIAGFAQREIRYVGYRVGNWGLPTAPGENVFAHRYGDCKDKATLVSAMLSAMGVESYYMMINSERDAVTPGRRRRSEFLITQFWRLRYRKEFPILRWWRM